MPPLLPYLCSVLHELLLVVGLIWSFFFFPGPSKETESGPTHRILFRPFRWSCLFSEGTSVERFVTEGTREPRSPTILPNTRDRPRCHYSSTCTEGVREGRGKRKVSHRNKKGRGPRTQDTLQSCQKTIVRLYNQSYCQQEEEEFFFSITSTKTGNEIFTFEIFLSFFCTHFLSVLIWLSLHFTTGYLVGSWSRCLKRRF